MNELFVRCTVPLEPPLTLAAQRDSRYETLNWQLSNGDDVSAELDVPEEEIDRLVADKSSDEGWWANVPVRNLHLHLILKDVDQDDTDRLQGKHPTAEWHVGNGKNYQEAPRLEERIVTDLLQAVNTVIESTRVRMGQYWLKPMELTGSPQHVLFDMSAKWRIAPEDDEPLINASTSWRSFTLTRRWNGVSKHS